MKKFFIQSFFIFVGMVFPMLAQAQVAGRYDVRLVPGAYNCAKDSVVVCVEIRATSADSVFVMGNANIYLIYNNNQLSSPVIRSRGIYSGGVYSSINTTKTPGAFTSAVSLNIVNNGNNAEGRMVDTQWRIVACLAFSTAGNAGKCYDLTLSASDPATVVTLAYPNTDDPQNNISLTRQVKQGNLSSIVNQCPANPIVTLSGGGTINTGGSANLIVSSQNSVLPATVVLSNSAGTVTLTQAEPSKTISVSPQATTNYTIQSVTGACGTGTGQGNANVVFNSSIPNPAANCSLVRCIPLTLRIIQ